MFRVVIVHGPSRGAAFDLKEGENKLGRSVENEVVLSSSTVSKNHCLLEVRNGKIQLKDEVSANGTFVNGRRVRKKEIKVGDQISVGTYVLQLVEVAGSVARRASPESQYSFPATDGNLALALPGPGGLVQNFNQNLNQGAENSGASQTNQPKDLREKVVYYFENFIMPQFYSMTLRNEWRFVAGALIAVLVGLNLLISIHPILQSSTRTLTREAIRRAQFVGRQIVFKNTESLAKGQENQLDTGDISKEDGITLALIVDMENRIVAPPERFNQIFADGAAAAAVRRAVSAYRSGRETTFVEELSPSEILTVEPFKIFDLQKKKNVVTHLVLVGLDTSTLKPDFGSIALAYSETLVITGILGLIVVFILYRLTLRPLEVLEDDIDRFLKGETSGITREFKFEELNRLLDGVDSALQRIPRSGAESSGVSEITETEFLESSILAFRELEAVKDGGFAFLDASRNTRFLNQKFSDTTGIRFELVDGLPLVQGARDESTAAMLQDLLEKAKNEGSATDSCEFSGLMYEMKVTTVGQSQVRGFLISILPKGNE